MTMNNTNKVIRKNDPEFGVDSKYKNQAERLSAGKELLEARLNRINQLPKNQIIKARLLQLKLQMEDYLKQPNHKNSNFFTNFLKTYIDTIYEKRVMFAKDIDITPVSLSQILNNHREPKDEFMFRLMLHSELTYEKVCNFEKETWYQVYYHEKVCDIMANQDEWKSEERKHVKIKHALRIG